MAIYGSSPKYLNRAIQALQRDRIQNNGKTRGNMDFNATRRDRFYTELTRALVVTTFNHAIANEQQK